MKPRLPVWLTLAVLSLAALPHEAAAKDRDRSEKARYYESKYRHSHDRYRHDERYVYLSRPSTSFVISFGNGYAGQGWYYGPPQSKYYYQRSGVVYYRRKEDVPRHYWGGGHHHDSYSRTVAEVQRALARRGYYRGPIDGDIGPGSRAAIARYQADRGMRPTGQIDSRLLRSLGL